MKTRANKAVAKVAFGALALNAAFPALAFAAEAEQEGGISAILPDMAEFIPMLIAFIILWIILAKFGWPMFAGMLEKRENTIREALKKSGKLRSSERVLAGVQQAAGRRQRPSPRRSSPTPARWARPSRRTSPPRPKPRPPT